MASDLQKLAKHSVVLVSGSEQSLRTRLVKELLEAVGSGPDDFSLDTFTADAKPVNEWLATVSVSPFLADRRVVLVRNLLRLDPRDLVASPPKKDEDHPLAKELKALPETAFLLLVADDEPGDDTKQRTLKTLRGRWEKLVKGGGGGVEVCDVDPKGLVDQLRKEAERLGKKMSVAAANALAEMSGGKLTVATLELDKLRSYVGDAPEIREQDVRAVASPERDYNVYKLVDAIVEGEAGRALPQLRLLFGKNEKVEEEAFPKVFPTLSRQFRMIWQARLCVEAGCSPTQPTAAVLAMLPDKPNIVTESEWGRRRAMAAARRLKLKQVTACFEELVTADARMKGLLPAYSGMETLEQMVLRMAAICR